KIDSSTLGLSGFSVSKNALKTSDAITQVNGAADAAPVSVDLSSAAKDLGVDASSITLHNVEDKTGNATKNYVVQSGSDFYAASVDRTSGKVVLNKADVKYTDPANGLTATATQAGQLVKVSTDKDGNTASYVTFQGKNYAALPASLTDTGSSLAADQTTAASTNAVTIQLSDKAAVADDPATAGVDETAAAVPATAEFEGAATANPLALLDKAIASVDTFRSSLGAVQNRLDSAITNLNNTTTNLSEAQSRIQDADYATEVSNMSKAQIIQQAGNSVLAKANQVPQQVLSLLQG
ncbi:flagellin, partial [Pantoea piersonii]|uniref:flagellin n=1 Tax=Pantoea piersonii TaxID=2364647 RepID=UPI0028980474